MRIARAVDLTTIDPELVDFGEHRCLIVRRFDRAVADDGTVTRLHQKDLCQAAAIDPDGAKQRAKYEAQGGPGFRAAAEFLRSYADDPVSHLTRLLEAMVFTVLIGNADAHGKNLALLHPTPETIALGPLYDTVPTALWPKLRGAAAMTIGGATVLADVRRDDLVREARSWAMPPSRIPSTVDDAIERIRAAAHAGTGRHDALRSFVLDRADGLARG